jgi:hypothetical protein
MTVARATKYSILPRPNAAVSTHYANQPFVVIVEST